MTTTPRKAYSYLRFSTPEQQRGDSFRRQTSMAQEYAVRHGLALDAGLTFQDLGVSAYRGANAEAGRLFDFLEAVRAGIVPQGSVLLVEALDRLSRLVPRKALRVLEDIISSGVSVVTLNDGREYTLENIDSDPMNLLVALMLFVRANEESATKARRLRQAWEGKRLTASTTPLTAVVPAWLRVVPDGLGRRIEPIPARVEVVRRMFAEYIAGSGLHSIADRLNREGVLCFGSRSSRWHRSYIKKTLDNPATHGVFVPHRYEFTGNKRVRVPLEPIPGYYPAAVSSETFEQAHSMRGTAVTPKARDGYVASLLAGLAVCPLCGWTMTRYSKGSRARSGAPKLLCTQAKAGGFCIRHAVDIVAVEEALITNAGLLVSQAPSGDPDVDGELAQVLTNIDATEDAMRNLMDSLSRGASAALSGRLQSLEADLGDLEQRRDVLLDMMAAASGPLVDRRMLALEVALEARPLDFAVANAAMRAVLVAVVVDYPEGVLRLRWKHGGESEVMFAMPMAA